MLGMLEIENISSLLRSQNSALSNGIYLLDASSDLPNHGGIEIELP
jgi:hypothetical protein